MLEFSYARTIERTRLNELFQNCYLTNILKASIGKMLRNLNLKSPAILRTVVLFNEQFDLTTITIIIVTSI